MFHEQQISIFERFVKDHVTLEVGTGHFLWISFPPKVLFCCTYLNKKNVQNKLSVSLWFLLGLVSDSVQKSSGPLQVDIARSAGSVLGLSLTTSLYRNKQVITIQKIKPASVADR